MKSDDARQRHHFGILLASMLALFAGSGVIDYVERFLPPRVVSGAFAMLLIFVLLAAVFRVGGGRRSVPARVAKILVAVTVVVQAVSVTLGRWDLALLARGLTILCIVYTIVVVLTVLMRATNVDTAVIHAAICVYLLMSVGWALWYSLLFFLEPGAFAEGHGLTTFGQQAMPGELYYSLVTLTTLGYGDVVPLTTAARMSAALEAMVGQIYVVIAVARLVGLQVSHLSSMPGRSAP